VQIFVEKTLRYEENLTQSEEAGVVAIADGQSASFRQDAEVFLSLFDQSHPTQLYAPDAGVVGANAQIKRNLEAGEWLVAYFGHGSVIMWGKDRLFTVEDVASLSTNRRLPVLLNMTCLTGLFTHPKTESLTEAMLWRPNGGAVAALAPSSLTLPTDQSFLSGALVDALQGGDGLRLGDMHLKARRAIPADTQGSLDVMMTFMLFGDPALQITR
jgi:hypothetical protein